MKAGYEPKTLATAMAHTVEECGEVVAAIGKTLRFGLYSSNPELPESEREKNIEWVDRELIDLEESVVRLRKMIAIVRELAS